MNDIGEERVMQLFDRMREDFLSAQTVARKFVNRIAHTNQLCLKDVKYLVQPAGRAKVLKEKKKNVHAGLSGYYVDRVPVPAISFDVTYNPYKYDSFVDTQDHEAQEWSEYAHLTCGDGWRNIEAIFTREYFSEKVKVPA